MALYGNLEPSVLTLPRCVHFGHHSPADIDSCTAVRDVTPLGNLFSTQVSSAQLESELMGMRMRTCFFDSLNAPIKTGSSLSCADSIRTTES